MLTRIYILGHLSCQNIINFVAALFLCDCVNSQLSFYDVEFGFSRYLLHMTCYRNLISMHNDNLLNIFMSKISINLHIFSIVHFCISFFVLLVLPDQCTTMLNVRGPLAHNFYLLTIKEKEFRPFIIKYLHLLILLFQLQPWSPSIPFI